MSGFLHDLYAVAWLATWGNNMAWLESLAATALTLWVTHRLGLLRRLTDRAGPAVGEWWGRVHPHRDKVDRALAAAEAAHRIAAATHEHLTGERHPDAPPRGDGP